MMNRMMSQSLASATLVVALSGCGVREEEAPPASPPGTQVYSAWGSIATVMPIQMQDGTHCVLVHTGHGDVALSCAWETTHD